MKRIQATILILSLFSCTPLFAVDGDAVHGGTIGEGAGVAVIQSFLMPDIKNHQAIKNDSILLEAIDAEGTIIIQ